MSNFKKEIFNNYVMVGITFERSMKFSLDAYLRIQLCQTVSDCVRLCQTMSDCVSLCQTLSQLQQLKKLSTHHCGRQAT